MTMTFFSICFEIISYYDSIHSKMYSCIELIGQHALKDSCTIVCILQKLKTNSTQWKLMSLLFKKIFFFKIRFFLSACNSVNF